MLEEVVYFFRFLRPVRKWLGGHWERFYDWGYPPHDNGKGWLPWRQRSCTHPDLPDTAGMPIDFQCEDWGPIRRTGG
jgi:hypothetical protein